MVNSRHSIKPIEPTALGALFEQRTIGPTYGSVSSRLPLRTPSGAQYTESKLETDIVIQLVFSMRVRDLITQPIIHFREGNKLRHYTPDVLVEMLPDLKRGDVSYLIEAKPEDHLRSFLEEGRERITAANQWCARHGAEYRILTEKEIRTPYLANAKALGRFIGQTPDPQILTMLVDLCKQNLSISQAVSALTAKAVPEYLARHAIEVAIANRAIGCDLSVKIEDSSFLTLIRPLYLELNDNDPFLKIIRTTKRSGTL
jgi:hypothetical protein